MLPLIWLPAHSWTYSFARPTADSCEGCTSCSSHGSSDIFMLGNIRFGFGSGSFADVEFEVCS